MKKLGFLAASMGAAVLLAVGAASVAHMVTHPSEVVEEANAAEIVPLSSPRARPENAPSRVRGTELARADGETSPRKSLAEELPPVQRTPRASALSCASRRSSECRLRRRSNERGQNGVWSLARRPIYAVSEGELTVTAVYHAAQNR